MGVFFFVIIIILFIYLFIFLQNLSSNFRYAGRNPKFLLIFLYQFLQGLTLVTLQGVT